MEPSAYNRSAAKSNQTRFDELAEVYDRARPTPPGELLDVLVQWAGGRPRLVVDLGCGTGLSTRIWSGRADAVVGIDPGERMLDQARARTTDPAIRYQAGPSHATGLPDASADVVTCSQSLHWMDTSATFAEAARILRPAGVFAAFDCDWPPTFPHWRLDEMFRDVRDRSHVLEQYHHQAPAGGRIDKSLHLIRMHDSGRFTFLKEFCLHSYESGDAERYIEMLISYSGVGKLLARGVSEADLGLDAARRLAAELLGDAPSRWMFTYRVRLGITPGV